MTKTYTVTLHIDEDSYYHPHEIIVENAADLRAELSRHSANRVQRELKIKDGPSHTGPWIEIYEITDKYFETLFFDEDDTHIYLRVYGWID